MWFSKVFNYLSINYTVCDVYWWFTFDMVKLLMCFKLYQTTGCMPMTMPIWSNCKVTGSITALNTTSLPATDPVYHMWIVHYLQYKKQMFTDPSWESLVHQQASYDCVFHQLHHLWYSSWHWLCHPNAVNNITIVTSLFT